MPVTFQLLLTLVSSSNAENAATLWGFIGRYRPGVTPQTHPKLDAMVGYACLLYTSPLWDLSRPRVQRSCNTQFEFDLSHVRHLDKPPIRQHAGVGLASLIVRFGFRCV